MTFSYEPNSHAAACGHQFAIDSVAAITNGGRSAKEEAARLAMQLVGEMKDCESAADANSMLYGALELLLDVA